MRRELAARAMLGQSNESRCVVFHVCVAVSAREAVEKRRTVLTPPSDFKALTCFRPLDELWWLCDPHQSISRVIIRSREGKNKKIFFSLFALVLPPSVRWFYPPYM